MSFLEDLNDFYVILGRADAWRGEKPTLAQRAWRGLLYSVAISEKLSQSEQIKLESAYIDFTIRQNIAFRKKGD